jgi:anti-sigma factor RsiW
MKGVAMSTEETCPRVVGLSALIDGETEAGESQALDTHLAQCPVCRAALADLQQLRLRWAAWPDPGIEFDLAPQIDRLIRPAPGAAGHRPVRGARLPSPWRWVVIAPGGLAALGLGLWLGASLVPLAGPVRGAGATAAQMAAFSAAPPGSLCLGMGSCGRVGP